MMLRLDLGGGERPYGHGYLNIDIDAGSTVDVVADIKELPFGDGGADVCLLSQVIEHLPREDADKVLGEAKRVLKPGGILRVAFPDLDKVFKNYRQLPFYVVERHLYGEQTDAYQFHRCGFTAKSMIAKLEALGFKRCREHAGSMAHQFYWLATEIEAVKGVVA